MQAFFILLIGAVLFMHVCYGTALESIGMKAPMPSAGSTPALQHGTGNRPMNTMPDGSGNGSFVSDAALGLMAIYSGVLHPGISRGCPSYPSCSRYMKAAIIQYGVPLGIVLGLERLLHETGELHRGTPVTTPEGIKIYDPLDNNTFWWHKSIND